MSEQEPRPEALQPMPNQAAEVVSIPTVLPLIDFRHQGIPRSNELQGFARLERRTSRSDEIAQSLGKRVLGQSEACRTIARHVAVIEAGMHDPRRPLAAVYQLGPTGVGKTEMGHALAEHFFDDPYSDRLKILNMGEYQEHHTARNFTGSPPSYVGSNEKGAIPHDWLHAGRSIIIFDEFDKAHEDIARTILSVLDKAKIQARNGEKGMQELNFSNAFLLFTSNDGAEQIAKTQSGVQLGFGNSEPQSKSHDAVARKELKERFKHMPEFLGRLTDIVVFKSLEPQVYEGILHKLIHERNENLREQSEGNSPYFVPTEEFTQYLLEKRDPAWGARVLKPLLDQELFAKAVDFLSPETSRQRVVVDFDPEDGVVFYTDRVQEQSMQAAS